MKKYKTAAGEIVTEQEAKALYGEKFQEYLDRGYLQEFDEEVKKKDAPEVITESPLENGSSDLEDQIEVQEEVIDVTPAIEKQTMLSNVGYTNMSDEDKAVLKTKETLSVAPPTNRMEVERQRNLPIDNYGNKYSPQTMYSTNPDGSLNIQKQQRNEQLIDAMYAYDGVNNEFNVTINEKNQTVSAKTPQINNINFNTNQEIIEPDVDLQKLSNLNIDVNDYLTFKQTKFKKETEGYKIFKNLFNTKDAEVFQKEKGDYQKVATYKANLLDGITKDIQTIDNKISLSVNPEEVKNLKKQKKTLEVKFKEELSSMSKIIDEFPVFKKYSQDLDLKKRKKFYESIKKGGGSAVLAATDDVIFSATNAIANFALSTFAAVPAILNQFSTLATGSSDKGVFAGISESLTDLAASYATVAGPVGRRGVVQGKPITYGGENYIVTKQGDVIDVNTNISVKGIITDIEYNEIVQKSLSIKNDVQQFTGGSLISGTTAVVANLIGLIKGGKAISRISKVNPSFGMGVASYASTMAANVEELKNDLIKEGGLSENDALNKAMLYGNITSTLDGIFSGLAGSNQKLLEGLGGVKNQLFNLIKKKGSKFKINELKRKGADLIKENLKEVFVEELPVLYSEKYINSLVNKSVGTIVRSSETENAEVYETIIMTLGATSSLGSRQLLSGNKRLDALRYVSKNVLNFEEKINELVDENMITREEGASVYQELYEMQAAQQKTQDTMVMSENIKEAADLQTRRDQLTDQAKNLSGPFKDTIEIQISDIDDQMTSLLEKDKREAALASEEGSVIIKDPTTAVSFEYDSEEDIPESLKSVEPKGKASIEIDGKKKIRLTYSGQQLIDAGVGVQSEIVTTEEEVKKSLLEKGIKNPTPEQILEESNLITNKKIKDADTIESPTEVLESKQSEVGGTVVEGDNKSTKPARETTQAKTKKTIESTQEGEAEVEISESEEVVIEEGKPLALNENKQVFTPVRDPKTPIEKKKKFFENIIQKLKAKGEIATRTVKSLIKEVNSLTYDNPALVERAISRITKTFEKANNLEALNAAEKIKNKIKNAVKGKSVDPYVSVAAKQFLLIDPLMVDSLTEYQKKADELLKGLRPSRFTSKTLKVAPAVDVKSTDEYTAKQLEAQKKAQEELDAKVQAITLEALTGKTSSELSLSDVRKESEEEKAEKKKKIIFEALKQAFTEVKSIAKAQLKSGINSITGEKINYSREDVNLVNAFANMNLEKLTPQEAKRAIDSLVNFSTNGTTSGMSGVVSTYIGRRNAEIDKKNGLVSKPPTIIRKLLQIYGEYISSVNINAEFIFIGQSKVRKFLKSSGYQNIVNGVAKAGADVEKISREYYDKFQRPSVSEFAAGKTKTMPNGEAFNTAKNNGERAILARIRRTFVGTETEQKAEFDRQKTLIFDSISRLNEGGGKEAELSVLYQELYDKLLKNSNSISEVEAKADKINLSAVEFITEKWSSFFPDLKKTNLNVYNKLLDEDINYTPDAYNFLEDPAKLEGKLGESVYDTGSKAKVYDKQTGVLKPNVRITSLPKNGYVDLNFDGQNFSNLEKALVDINTAESVRQVSGYIYSDAFKDIVTDRIERQALIKRIEEFVAAKRKVGFENKNTPANLKKLEKTINFIAQTAVSRTLGSLGQVPKQLAPLVNTLFNAGPINTLLGISLTLTNPKVKEFLKKSGRNIATRGLESSTQLDNNNTRLEKSATGGLIEKNTQKFFRNLSAVQKGWLNELLVKPDKFAANASWIAYYLQNMEKQKKDPNNIDWNTHKINNEAADYAQYQVDRQQNVSDRELQGKILRSNNFVIKNAVRIVLPFSNFLLNQKSRMYADVQTVFSLSAGKEDKVTALRSLTGLAAETYTFQTLGYVFTNILAEMSALGDEDEEEKEKMKRNRIKGKIGTVAKDIFSPIPLPAIDDAVIGLSNKIIEQISNDDEDASLLFEERASKPLERLGLYSIGVEKAKVAYDLIKIGQGKEIEDDYGNLMSFSEQERILAKNTALFYVPYLFGILPGEAGTIGYYNLKAIKKNKIKKSRKKKEY